MNLKEEIQNSGLGQLMMIVKQHIVDIKKKYPNNNENKAAYKRLDEFSKLIDNLSLALERFIQAEYFKLGLVIPSLSSLFSVKEMNKLLEINHPMVFEFFETILLLLQESQHTDLDNLISFFDPSSVSMHIDKLINLPIIGGFINKALKRDDIQYEIEYNQKNGKYGYTIYSIQTKQTKQNDDSAIRKFVRDIDVSTYYINSKKLTIDFLTDHLQHAEGKVLPDLAQQKKWFLLFAEQEKKHYCSGRPHIKNFSTAESEDALEKIFDCIQQNDVAISECENVIEQTKCRLQQYQDHTIEKLCEPYSHLLCGESLKLIQDERFKESYLPHMIHIYENKDLKKWDIRKELTFWIESQKKNVELQLSSHKKIKEDNLKILTNKHLNRHKDYLQKLNVLHEEKIASLFKTEISMDALDNIESIQKSLEMISDVTFQCQNLQNHIEQINKEMNGLAQGHQMEACYQEANQKIMQMQQALIQYQEKLNQQETNIKQAQHDLAMQSLDVETIEKHIHEAKNLLNQQEKNRINLDKERKLYYTKLEIKRQEQKNNIHIINQYLNEFLPYLDHPYAWKNYFKNKKENLKSMRSIDKDEEFFDRQFSENKLLIYINQIEPLEKVKDILVSQYVKTRSTIKKNIEQYLVKNNLEYQDGYDYFLRYLLKCSEEQCKLFNPSKKMLTDENIEELIDLTEERLKKFEKIKDFYKEKEGFINTLKSLSIIAKDIELMGDEERKNRGNLIQQEESILKSEKIIEFLMRFKMVVSKVKSLEGRCAYCEGIDRQIKTHKKFLEYEDSMKEFLLETQYKINHYDKDTEDLKVLLRDIDNNTPYLKNCESLRQFLKEYRGRIEKVQQQQNEKRKQFEIFLEKHKGKWENQVLQLNTHWQKVMNFKIQERKTSTNDLEVIVHEAEEFLKNYNNHWEEETQKELKIFQELLPNNHLIIKYLQSFLEHKKELADKLPYMNSLVSEVNQRINNRKMLAEKYQTALNNYLGTRNQRYSIKDKIWSADRKDREQHIADIKNALNIYMETGDFNYLHHYKKFGGLKLQSLLNRMMMEITEQKNQVPQNYNDSIVVKPQPKKFEKLPENLGQNYKALENLLEQANALKTYGEKLQNSSNNKHKQYGETAVQLGKALADKVIQFAHQDNKDMKLDAFKSEFLTLLHSQDDTMNQRRSYWKPVLANFTAALLTLGIALLVKAIHSKHTIGRVSLFACKTERMLKVDEITATVDQLNFKINND